MMRSRQCHTHNFLRSRWFGGKSGYSLAVDKTRCPRCDRVGFVRLETVVRGGRTSRSYYCGGCEYTWEIAEGEAEKITEPRVGSRSDKQ